MSSVPSIYGSKQIVFGRLPHKSPSNDEVLHLTSSSLEVVMNRFSTLTSSNCHNFVSNLKHFVCSGMDTMDSIMALKDHLGFKCVQVPKF